MYQSVIVRYCQNSWVAESDVRDEEALESRSDQVVLLVKGGDFS